MQLVTWLQTPDSADHSLAEWRRGFCRGAMKRHGGRVLSNMDKAISLNEIRSRCAEFVVKWRDAVGEEKQEDQSFIRDLLRAFGISETRAALYQKRSTKSSTGTTGYIDALVPGLLLIEIKSAGKNLGLAEIQAMDYMQNLSEAEEPRYVLTSDFKRFRLLDLVAPKGSDVIEFSLEELPKKAEVLSFLAGYGSQSFGNFEQEEASIKAAQLMADLYEALDGSGYEDHEASIFLVRTLFALYADDSGVWAKSQFTDFIENRTSADGSDLGQQLSMLYEVLNTPLDSRFNNLDESLSRFPYVNGGVFAERLRTPAFDKKMRDKLLRACHLDWSDISPAIFGSLFQAVKSAEARRELGEHYTTEKNILKTIRPLFLDELEQKFANSKSDINALIALRRELAAIRVFDPACGCGNFLVVSYRELRHLELQILLRLQELGDKTSVPTLFFAREELSVQLEHIFGIEIEEWPRQIAQTALLLAEHQSNQAMQRALGVAPTILPLETVDGIYLGNALRLDWREILEPDSNVRIVGNPPFVGHVTKNVDQVADLKTAWGEGYDGYLDYVTAWFKKSIDFFRGVRGGRFAFVSTNSVSQGQPVGALFIPIFEDGWRIRFAHQTFGWSSEAPGMASVHCVITGFDKNETSTPEIYSYATPNSTPLLSYAKNINGYLVDSPNVFISKRSKPLSVELPETNFGTMPLDGGNLLVEPSEISEVELDPIAKKYLRKFLMGKELIHGKPRFCLWLEDVSSSELAESKFLRARVEACREYRFAQVITGDAFKYRQTPHLFRTNPKRPQVSYLAIPAVFSENRKYATCDYLPPEVIAGNKLYTCEDPDGFAFAMISSSMFITWQKAVGGRLKSDPSFSNTIVWNNLPLSPVSSQLRQRVIEAGKDVLIARRLHPQRSLADHYNPLAMDPTLLKAHTALDKVVDKAFGATKALRSNVEREELLFKKYVELTSSSTA